MSGVAAQGSTVYRWQCLNLHGGSTTMTRYAGIVSRWLAALFRHLSDSGAVVHQSLSGSPGAYARALR